MPNYCKNNLSIEHITFEQYEQINSQLESEKFLSYYLPVPEVGDSNEWRYQNWGTKWDIQNVFFHSSEGGIWVDFNTAWTPCLSGIQEISKHFPDAYFILTYCEEGVGFGGGTAYKNGEELSSTTFEPSDVMNQWLEEWHEDITDQAEKDELIQEAADEVLSEHIRDLNIEIFNSLRVPAEEEDWDTMISNAIDYADEIGLNPDHVIGARLGGVDIY